MQILPHDVTRAHLCDVGGVIDNAVKVNALEGAVAQHGTHAQGRALQDVVLSDLQQAPVISQAPHSCLRMDMLVITRSSAQHTCASGADPAESGIGLGRCKAQGMLWMHGTHYMCGAPTLGG